MTTNWLVNRIGILTFVLLCSASAGYALVCILGQGSWPDTWPEEFEAYRDQAQTFDGSFTAETFYCIAFTDREEFERLWPHILEVKTPGAPLTLWKSPIEAAEGKVIAGVRIITPYRGVLEHPAIEALKADPATWATEWKIPEYVTKTKDGWVESHRDDPSAERARVDIVLTVDGDIVDLNRIPLPGNTHIVDERKLDSD